MRHSTATSEGLVHNARPNAAQHVAIFAEQPMPQSFLDPGQPDTHRCFLPGCGPTLVLLWDMLNEHVGETVDLEQVARRLGVSFAIVNRALKRMPKSMGHVLPDGHGIVIRTALPFPEPEWHVGRMLRRAYPDGGLR